MLINTPVQFILIYLYNVYLGVFTNTLPNIMKHLAIAILISLSTASFAQNKKDSILEHKVVVKLIEKIDTSSLPPYCGYFITQQTLKYKVLGILKGTITDSVIYINRTCIRELYEKGALDYNKVSRLWIKKSEKVTPFNSCNFCLEPKKIITITYDVFYKK